MNRGRFPPLLYLHFISLSHAKNQFSGQSVPSLAIAAMPILRHLHLAATFFRPDPSQYGTWQHLTSSWETSPKLGNLTALGNILRHLHLGGIPSEIGNLSQLFRFNAAYCGLSGDIPADLGRLQNMDTLFLQVNALSSWGT
ncbi:leucine-rich repeat receptor-like serine/threonine-protein kinase BAM2 [Vigna umbellata]|uniref:leucine-rich repeat receptor-like serine/threonine-protein kinase BAM2 n=1 Tax=Vigna umbellata TaxID=87088 RepID=UPI001F5F312A|nr:leucine-rich repeat receptor-like serine/threonine-protein kinase BAM2 [Vigna umbellata]